jgi:hypothetical protein
MPFTTRDALTVAELLRNAAKTEILPRFGNLSEVQIPIQSGQPFRSEVGRDSDLKPAIVPI